MYELNNCDAVQSVMASSGQRIDADDCIFSLQTCESEWMPLETWSIEWDPNVTDPNVRVSFMIGVVCDEVLRSRDCVFVCSTSCLNFCSC